MSYILPPIKASQKKRFSVCPGCNKLLLPLEAPCCNFSASEVRRSDVGWILFAGILVGAAAMLFAINVALYL